MPRGQRSGKAKRLPPLNPSVLWAEAECLALEASGRRQILFGVRRMSPAGPNAISVVWRSAWHMRCWGDLVVRTGKLYNVTTVHTAPDHRQPIAAANVAEWDAAMVRLFAEVPLPVDRPNIEHLDRVTC